MNMHLALKCYSDDNNENYETWSKHEHKNDSDNIQSSIQKPHQCSKTQKTRISTQPSNQNRSPYAPRSRNLLKK